VEWLARQPWCNGRVGTTGTSYCAWMQWTLARLRPPHLLAMSAVSIPTTLADVDWWGAFRPGRRIKWWLGTIAPDLRKRAGMSPPHTPAEARQIWDELEHGRWLGLLPWSEVVNHLPPPLADHVASWLADPGRKPWRFAEAHRDITVPNLDVSGWYDHCCSIAHLPDMQRNGASEIARRQTKLVLGPYAHNTLGKRVCNDVDFGAQAQLDLDGLKIRWFDHWLKELDNGVDREPPVRYFVMGTGRWASSSTWPPPGGGESTFFLTSDGGANGAEGDGKLLPVMSGRSAESDQYTYNPHDPVPTLWSRALFAGASDRRALDHRRDILVYRSEPLGDAVEIAGAAQVVLHASSSAPDTDFFARLIDEHPDGQAIEVAYGMVRARYRDGVDQEKLLSPGEPARFLIRLTDTAVCFRPGHRIRVDVTSSDFPNFDRNHNTGGNDLFEVEMVSANQTVLHSPDHPSRLILPIAPTVRAATTGTGSPGEDR